MEIELSIQERLSLIQILPREGSYDQLVIIKSIKKKLELTQQEIEDAKVVVIDKSIRWDENYQQTATISFTTAEEKILHDHLDKANSSKQLKLTDIRLYEVFVLGGKLNEV